MSPPLTVRSRRLLDHVGPTADDQAETFAQVDEETHATTTLLIVSARTWAILGSPEQVTITIEPGDLLNGEPT